MTEEEAKTKWCQESRHGEIMNAQILNWQDIRACELKFSILQHKQHMDDKELSCGRYYTDPYGRDADMRILKNLEKQLEEITT